MAKEQGSENTANKENNNNNNELPIDPETAKQERQQENGYKRNVIVEFTGKYFMVKNEGDDRPIYESETGEATLEFAKKIADEHNVELIISDRAKEGLMKQKEEAEQERNRKNNTRSGKREDRRRGERKTEGPRSIVVEDDGKYYIVRNEGDRAKLYESQDKEATLEFARKMAQQHEVDLIMMDRDRRVVLEEKYNNVRQEEEDNAGEAS